MANEKRLIFVDAVLTGIATFKECYEGAGLKPWILEQIHTALQMVERFVKEYPTVDAVEVVRGRWEHTHEGIYLKVRCTACGVDAIKVNTDVYQADGLRVKWAYCPNCGAKMDGDGNGN